MFRLSIGRWVCNIAGSLPSKDSSDIGWSTSNRPRRRYPAMFHPPRRGDQPRSWFARWPLYSLRIQWYGTLFVSFARCSWRSAVVASGVIVLWLVLNGDGARVLQMKGSQLFTNQLKRNKKISRNVYVAPYSVIQSRHQTNSSNQSENVKGNEKRVRIWSSVMATFV